MANAQFKLIQTLQSLIDSADSPGDIEITFESWESGVPVSYTIDGEGKITHSYNAERDVDCEPEKPSLEDTIKKLINRVEQINTKVEKNHITSMTAMANIHDDHREWFKTVGKGQELTIDAIKVAYNGVCAVINCVRGELRELINTAIILLRHRR